MQYGFIILYGGVNAPVKGKAEELALKITREFAGYTKKELKELKKELQGVKLDRDIRNKAIRIVDEIPFIRSNNEELQRVLKQKTNSNLILNRENY